MMEKNMLRLRRDISRICEYIQDDYPSKAHGSDCPCQTLIVQLEALQGLLEHTVNTMKVVGNANKRYSEDVDFLLDCYTEGLTTNLVL